MPDFVYLLENRLSADQRNALRKLREVAADAGTILFLTGDAVRDLTSGHAVRELQVVVHGSALKLKKPLEKAGGKIWGEDEASRTLYLCFPGTVRVDVISAHRVEYPKPGKPVYHPASIQEDLRRRDFTVNAMAISLNEGSFGLLMDPLNGAADIEARTLRLVSNYGFLEEPALLIRAARYKARLGWELDQKTQSRYDNAREEGVIEHLSAHQRGEELEQIGHEEDGLKVLEALEAAGWMKVLFPAWTAAKADVEGLKRLHEQAVELLLQGIHPDMSAAQMQLLTAKLGSKDLTALKKLMLRPGFVAEWNSLDSLAAGFSKVLLSKEKQVPSAAFKLFLSYDPEAVLWLWFTSKSTAVLERYELFLKTWPEARQRIPHALMQEMRITPELPTHSQIVESVFLELIDGRLTTPEEMRAFLEPHSPPAPPPQVTIKRARVKRGSEPKIKERAFDNEEEEDLDDDDLGEAAGDEDEIDLGLVIPKGDLDAELDEGEPDVEVDDEDADDEEADREPAAGKRGSRGKGAVKAAKESPAPVKARGAAPVDSQKKASATAIAPKTEKSSKTQSAGKIETAPPVKPANPPDKLAAGKAKPMPALSLAKLTPTPPAKPLPVPAKSAKPTAAKPAEKTAPGKAANKTPDRTLAKAPAKAAAKAVAQTPAKASAKKAAAKSAVPAKKKLVPATPIKSKPAAKSAKPAAKKPAPKPKKKH
jgi:tRNA nucleotidyltransferase (CCA-adding enzyme)